jgi:hypothetical protein
MTQILNMPPAQLAPGAGLFRNDHFQIAYVTNDIERAMKVFADRYGVTAFRTMEGPLPAGGHIRVEFAWAGGALLEVTQADGPGSELFREGLPTDGTFAIRYHHLGYLVPDEAGWQALEAELEKGGVKVISKGHQPGFLRTCIVEAPELGHYIEYILPEAGGQAFFEGVPQN